MWHHANYLISDVLFSCLQNQDNNCACLTGLLWGSDDILCVNGLNIVSGIVKYSNHIYEVILILLSWNSKKISIHLSSPLCKRHTELCASLPSKPLPKLFPLPKILFLFPFLFSKSYSFCKSFFFLIYLFICFYFWLCRVLAMARGIFVAACRIFSCGMQTS